MRTKVEIQNETQRIIDLYNAERLVPFPYARVAEDRSDLTIKFFDFPGNAQDISGAISYKDDMFSIFINTNNSVTRQYFTLAHELGHYFLHGDYLKSARGIVDANSVFDSGQVLYRNDVPDTNDAQNRAREVEANNFAAFLTMPEGLVRKAWNKTTNVKDIAGVFDVSIVAMAIRLQNLNLVDT